MLLPSFLVSCLFSPLDLLPFLDSRSRTNERSLSLFGADASGRNADEGKTALLSLAKSLR